MADALTPFPVSVALWMLVDTAFPTGGFAHSAGLEAAVQHRVVTDAETLRDFLRVLAVQHDRLAAPLLLKVWASASAFSETDQRCDALLTSEIANRASRRQGGAMLSSAARIFATPEIEQARVAAVEREAPMHLAPVFGLVTGMLGLPREEMLTAARFTTVRDAVSAAVRLNVVGPTQGQRLQHELLCSLPGYETFGGHEEPASTSPLLDLLQATQDRLYSRLFQS